MERLQEAFRAGCEREKALLMREEACYGCSRWIDCARNVELKVWVVGFSHRMRFREGGESVRCSLKREAEGTEDARPPR